MAPLKGSVPSRRCAKLFTFSALLILLATPGRSYHSYFRFYRRAD